MKHLRKFNESSKFKNIPLDVIEFITDKILDLNDEFNDGDRRFGEFPRMGGVKFYTTLGTENPSYLRTIVVEAVALKDFISKDIEKDVVNHMASIIEYMISEGYPPSQLSVSVQINDVERVWNNSSQIDIKSPDNMVKSLRNLNLIFSPEVLSIRRLISSINIYWWE